jgi:pyruvate-ferredoxin/flavodoxin oxidoreductase
VQDRALEAPYPGIPTTGDGADMVVWAETQISQGAVAFPITSSTTMGQGFEAAYAAGVPNLWGEELVFMEPESEHSSASAAEGFALSGGRVTNFTSGQGLVLMKEVLYTISGKRLPVVFHIGARALTSQSLNVHAGHDDVMAVSDCGWGMLFARDGQEAGDLALISRRAAEDSATPFFNVQDGFLTTHTIQNYLQTEPEFMKEFVGSPTEKLHNLMDPRDPVMSGVVQNQDSYMKGKIAQRAYTDRVSEALAHAFDEFAAGTGRRYDFVRPYRLEDAEYAIVAMGSMIETAEATIDWLREERGLRVGALQVTSFRPFPGRQIVEALRHVRAFAVVERMDNPLAESNPLTLEVKAAFADAIVDGRIDRLPRIDSGVAGLGSRDVRASDFVAVAENLATAEPRRFFVLGVDHGLTLPAAEEIDVRPRGSFSMRGHSVGGFGSITTNKIIATVMADLFDLRVQAFPKYGSEKKGLPTNYYLTIAPEPIRIHSELDVVEFVALNDVNAFNLADPLAGLASDGLLFLQSTRTDAEHVWADIPGWAQQRLRDQRVRVLALDGMGIAREVASNADLVQRMQGIVLLGVFLRATPFFDRSGQSQEQLFERIEAAVRKYFGRRGEQVVQDNLRAIRRGFDEVIEIPASVTGAEAIAV